MTTRAFVGYVDGHVPFTAYGEEGPMVAGWKDFVLEVACSDVEYAYLFVPEHGWMGTQIHHDWKRRLRDAPSKKDAIQTHKLKLRPLSTMVREGEAELERWKRARRVS